MTDTDTPNPIDWRDLLERAIWTGVAAGLSAPTVIEITTSITTGNVTTLQLAALSVLSAVVTALVNALTVIARYKLEILPDPGAGIPARARTVVAHLKATPTEPGTLAVLLTDQAVIAHIQRNAPGDGTSGYVERTLATTWRTT